MPKNEIVRVCFVWRKHGSTICNWPSWVHVKRMYLLLITWTHQVQYLL